MHTDYLSPTIRQLRDQQVRFAPYEKQIQQANSAEELLNELDPKRTYSCEYVCHRVTNNGYESKPGLKFTGKEARHDLRLFVEDLSDAARVPASAVGERVLTEAKPEVYQQYRRGESVEALAQRFCRAPSGIYRIIKEMRAARLMELPLDSLGNEQFARLRSQKKKAEILGPLPESDLPTKKPQLPSGLPPYLASLYEVPLLTREQEVHLFRRMNYLKYKASRLRDTLDVNRPKSRLMNQIEKLYNESVTTKNHIIRANLRLVVSIAKRYVGRAGDFFEAVSDGNMSLIKAVEKFDVSRGNRFSTYASWAIMKNFARTIADVLRHRGHFFTSHSEMFTTVEDARADHYEQESAQIQRESHVGRLLDRLDERERQIVTSRFGLTRGHDPLTLRQVGAAMGVTKERIRQIQCRAMNKLRKAAKEDRID
jgi:RNA polymerase primary sigma factor/RNA polymerase sigma factor